MDGRLITGVLAGAAAVVLGVSAADAAFNDFAEVPGNRLGAGVLQLDLDAAGSGAAQLSVGPLMPGESRARVLWVATNDVTSTVDATLAVTLHRLADVAAPCDAGGDKAEAEIAAGIGGCTVIGDVASGTPAQGNLSRVLQFAVAYGRTTRGPGDCDESTPTTALALPQSGRGNLFPLATGNGSSVVLGDDSSLVLAPGAGVCIAVTASWPPDVGVPDRDHPADTAAQGDSLSFELRFDLTQVHS